LQIDPNKVQTNIVIFDCKATGLDAVQLCDALKPHGIWALDTAPYSVRFVTHCDVDAAGIERALVVLRDVVSKTRGTAA
jgi:threonine aldolase